MIKAVLNFDDGSVVAHSSNIEKTSTKFDPGFYKAHTDQQGNVHIKKVAIEELHEPYPEKTFIEVHKYCKKFFSKPLKDKINKMGFNHKIGVLLHGKQGTGKTSFLYYLASEVVKKYKGIVFITDSENSLVTTSKLMKDIRQIQLNPVVVIGDEFERWAQRAESEMKNLLDGVDSIDNQMFLAATNYIDKVPDSLKDRPSRFKLVAQIEGISNIDVIKKIIKDKSDKIELFTEAEIQSHSENLVKDTPTLDEVKNFMLDHLLEVTLKINKKTIGFGSSKVDEKKVEDEKKTILYEWS